MFDNLVFRGGMTSCKIKFSIKKPSDSTIAAVVTVSIEFMPEVPVRECVVEEGQGFDRKVSMTESCDHALLLVSTRTDSVVAQSDQNATQLQHVNVALKTQPMVLAPRVLVDVT